MIPPHAIRVFRTLLICLVGLSIFDSPQLRAQRLLDLSIGERIGPVALHTLDGQRELSPPGNQRIFVFWATWSPSSRAALRDLLASAPRSAVNWRIVPINVDSPVPRDPARIDSIARSLGYHETAWIDRRLELFAQWGVGTVPTVIVTGIDGTVAAIESGWDDARRDRVADRFFGTLKDTTVRAPSDTVLPRCQRRMVSAQGQWRNGRYDSAMAMAARLECTGTRFPDAQLALAHWNWERRDTARTLHSADAAIDADSLDPWTWLTRAVVRHRLGRHQDARADAERSLSLDSLCAPAWATLGRTALALGDTIAAGQAVTRLDRLNRHDPALEMIRARLLESRGDLKRAAASWRKALGNRLRMW